MQRIVRRGLSLLLLCSVLLSLSLPVFAMADSSALPPEKLEKLLERQTLHPQITGCVELDAILEKQLGPSENKSTMERLQDAYAWVIRQIQYSWRPYSRHTTPAYDYFGVQHELTYVDGLQEAMPREVLNRVYHALNFHEGVCYDYAAAFAVIARYIGLEAYVHTGYVNISRTEAPYRLHHGYTIIVADGERLIFDPQIDMRRSTYHAVSYENFGIPEKHQWRYEMAEEEANEERDSQFLPVDAERKYTPHIYATASFSGVALGDGLYEQGEKVRLRAIPKFNSSFQGWYDENGNLCSKKLELTVWAEKSCHYRAVFNKEYFADIPSDCWYRDLAVSFWEKGWIKGSGDFCFHGEEKITRAAAISLLCEAMEGKPARKTTFSYRDVPEDAWYYDALTWGVRQEIVKDVFIEQNFLPNAPVTRSEFLHMLVHCAWMQGMEGDAVFLPYYDIVTLRKAPIEALRHAQSWGLLQGFEDGSARPHNPLTRAEAAQLLTELLQLLESREKIAA